MRTDLRFSAFYAALLTIALSTLVAAENSSNDNPIFHLEKSGAQLSFPADNAEVTVPLSLASADFNEDGIADLLCGYASSKGGILAIYDGNEQTYFSPSARTVSVAIAPEFLHAGDFDADGHQDVVISHRLSSSLYFLPGNGKGKFRRTQFFKLDGNVTALATGDVNRDGLTDIVVSTIGEKSSKLVTLASPEGAIKSKPYRMTLPQAANIVHLAQLDSDPLDEIVVAIDREISIVKGKRELVRFSTPMKVVSITSGRYKPQSNRNQLRLLYEDGSDVFLATRKGNITVETGHYPAFQDYSCVMPTRINHDAFTDFVVLDRQSKSPWVVLTAALTTFTVTSKADSGAGSLRQAIIDANNQPGLDTIVFNIAGTVPHSIALASALPAITDPVTIDGTTQPGFAGKPVIELNGAAAGSTADGITVAAGSTVIRGLVINRFAGSGIALNQNGFNFIEANYIGTDANGTTDQGNVIRGIRISSSNNTIGGTVATARNLISGNNNTGIFIEAGFSGNVILGNFVGTDFSGSTAIPNGSGILTQGQSGNSGSTTIGGTVAGSRNLVSGNSGSGISLGGTLAGNMVQGNFIGTDITGTMGVGNGSNGIAIQFGSCCNLIGGTGATAGNLISGNANNGIRSDYHPNTIQGNRIGTQENGNSPLGNNLHGVLINSFGNNTIGGTAEGAGNTIAFNGGRGVDMTAAGPGNPILKNRIFENAALGIDLGPAGVTANDPGDGDSGPNNLQNFPILTSVTSTNGSSTITGTLNSIPDQSFRIDFFSNPNCDPSNHGEGETWIGSSTITTDGNGAASFSVTFAVSLSDGSFISANATDNSNNSSEFSECFPVGTACSFAINPTAESFSHSGGTGNVNVTTNAGCNWTATSNASWISVLSGDTGTGSGQVVYSVSENVNESPRIGTLTIAGETFTVTQSGNPGVCTFSISPTSKSFGRKGGKGKISVSASSNCSWTAISNVSWVTIQSGGSGTGNGIVSYSVASNSGGPRSGTITIADRTFTVNQK